MSKATGETEHIKTLLVGKYPGPFSGRSAQDGDSVRAGGIFHTCFAKVLLISMNSRKQAEGLGLLSVRFWDFLSTLLWILSLLRRWPWPACVLAGLLLPSVFPAWGMRFARSASAEAGHRLRPWAAGLRARCYMSVLLDTPHECNDRG